MKSSRDVLSNNRWEIEMKSEHQPYGIYEKYFKRLMDIICASVAIIVFSWLYIIIAILVKVKLGSPIIFKQKRPGKNEKIFNMYKFRTMTDARDESGDLLPDERRLTKFGRFLRSTSLDELPEAFCILFGTMSVVGPRPLLISYLPWYSEQEKHRHDVLPGLTGLAQVNGRNFVGWDARLAYDVKYVNKITFCGDVKIILQTVGKFLKKQDIAVDTRRVETNFAEERKQKQINLELK